MPSMTGGARFGLSQYAGHARPEWRSLRVALCRAIGAQCRPAFERRRALPGLRFSRKSRCGTLCIAAASSGPGAIAPGTA